MTDLLQLRYAKYVADYDPSPYYSGDPYTAPLSFEDWCAWDSRPHETDDSDCYMTYSNSDVI